MRVYVRCHRPLRLRQTSVHNPGLPRQLDVLGEFREKVESVEHMQVFLEVARVRGVKQYAAFERLIADLLHRDWGSCDVFSQTLLRGLVKDANAAVPLREKGRK